MPENRLRRVLSSLARPRPDELDRDLGIGGRAALESRQRFLNRDGSFNVRREGLPFFRSLSLYHALLTMSWPRFFALAVAGYVATNVAFAVGYLLCGPDALAGLAASSLAGRAQACFFFSVQTLATIGYGGLTPVNLAANLLVTFEALLGLGGFALATGLLFARFSRPEARVAFSDRAVVAPYRDGTALMIRVLNVRRSQLLDVKATLTMGWNQGGGAKRTFHVLGLERKQVVFFPLHWVVVHPIDEASPFAGVSEESFRASGAEIFLLLSGVDEAFSQTVHARRSYRADEVVWGGRFADMFVDSPDGRATIDVRRLSEIEPIDVGAGPADEEGS